MTTQEQIIKTAAQLIKEMKTNDVTLTQIATRLGMTHAALYKHFKNKNALWEAVAVNWFQQTILATIDLRTVADKDKTMQLHEWLWQFVQAKKRAYDEDSQMFTLNTQYVDNNPAGLRRVLTSAYQMIDEIMGYHDPEYRRAEAIMSAFAVFTLPNFQESWHASDYPQRFEAIWQLIVKGL